MRCRDVLIEGVTIEDAPFYGVHLVYCENAVVERVTGPTPLSGIADAEDAGAAFLAADVDRQREPLCAESLGLG